LKSHIPSSASADAAKLVAHAMAKVCNLGCEKKLLSIAQHRMLACARQLLSYRRLSTRAVISGGAHQIRRLRIFERAVRFA